MQTSLLYSNKNRQRRVRIHNSCIKLSNDIKNIYESIDADAYSSMMIKEELQEMYKYETPMIRNRIVN